MLDLDHRLIDGPLRVQSIWSAEQTRSLRREVLERRRRRFVWRVAFSSAAMTGLLFSATRFYHAHAAQLPLVAAVSAPAVAEAVPQVHYVDGSVAELGTPGSSVHLDQQTADYVSSTVVSGRARFDVVPNHGRTFEVHAGDVVVRVLGTAFAVERSGSSARISVERGRVRVSWPGGEAELGVGEAGEFPPIPIVSELPPSAASAAPIVPGATGQWRDLAKRGQYAQAFVVLHRAPNDVRDEPADLMLAADVARLSSHPAQAVAPLRKLSARYPKDPRAPVAAFTLGRVLLDNLGRAGDAAGAFELAERLWPGGPLASDALAREAESLKKSGQVASARAVAKKYLAIHPEGRHAPTLRAMLTD